jgi:polysaccharide pyruvyl transferase WcaK-like protein
VAVLLPRTSPIFVIILAGTESCDKKNKEQVVTNMSVFTDGLQSDDSFWYVLSSCFLRYFVNKYIMFIRLSAMFFCSTNLRHKDMRRLATVLRVEKLYRSMVSSLCEHHRVCLHIPRGG